MRKRSIKLSLVDEGSITDSPPGKLQSLSKILSLIAIPIVAAFLGWVIDADTKQAELRTGNVKLALSILNKSPEKIDPAIRKWAANLLSINLDQPLPSVLVDTLSHGEIARPAPSLNSLVFSLTSPMYG